MATGPKDAEQARAWVGARASSTAKTKREPGSRTTLDLLPELHRALKLWCLENDAQMAPVLRGLVVEMLMDDELSERVAKRARGEM